jgi:hypothetical protein
MYIYIYMCTYIYTIYIHTHTHALRQESEGITTQTDCYSFATLMWDCATRGYAWQGLGLLHVRSAVLDLGALLVRLFAAGRGRSPCR